MAGKCPTCGARALCFDSRQPADPSVLRRRRYRCAKNGEHRWTTVEILVGGGRKALDAWKNILREEGRNDLRAEMRRTLGSHL